MLHTLLSASKETLMMVFMAGGLSLVLGLILGMLLYLAQSKPRSGFSFVNILSHFTESLPYVILMLAFIPLARWSSENAYSWKISPSIIVILPLTLITIPFFSRFIAQALNKVSKDLIEVAESMGASRLQIIRKCLIPEALADIIQGFTKTLIYLVGFSMVAGILGYGGLGQLAMNKGYYSFEIQYLIAIALILTALIQIIQKSGQYLAHGHP